jgi:hypothetical protein
MEQTHLNEIFRNSPTLYNKFLSEGLSLAGLQGMTLAQKQPDSSKSISSLNFILPECDKPFWKTQHKGPKNRELNFYFWGRAQNIGISKPEGFF